MVQLLASLKKRNDMKRENDIIRADKGLLLVYIGDGTIWGKAARLASYNGKVLEEGDFEERDFEDLYGIGWAKVDGEWYCFKGMTYAEIKTFVVKLHYSYDDQIALMLNYDEFPSEYGQRYEEMQAWRDVAANIARRITETNQQ